MSFLDSLFDSGKPYREAREEMEKYFQQAKGYQEPSINAGKDQLPILTGAENQLMDPSQLLAQWMDKYNMSPMARQDILEAKNSGLDAASSMGLMGSSAALNNIQSSASNIMNKDRQQFLNDLMQKYLAGIGIGQNIYNTGANSATNLANQAVKVGGDAAQLKYGEEAAPGALWGKLFGSALDMGANYATGGMYGAGKAAASYTG